MPAVLNQNVLFWASTAIAVFIFLFYVRPLRRSYLEMSDRASLFAKSADYLRQEKRALLENLEEGVMTLDGGGRISYVNLKVQSLLQVGHENLLGKSYKEIVSAHAEELWQQSQKLISEVLSWEERVHTFFTLSESRKIYLELIGVPTGSGSGVLLIMQDKSNQQKILKMGKEFVANASHELKTPVTIIRGFAETLQDLPEVSDVMFESILEKIVRNCERMENLVTSLLTLADLENSTLERVEECDLVMLVENVCMLLLNVYPDVQFEQLHNEEKIVIWGAKGLLELAFTNILKNAIKYSKIPKAISITIEALKDEVSIAFQDNGIGIKEEDLERIFDRFYTVDKAHSRRLGGAGLGLSIVKMIIDKHDAKIWVTSKFEEGSTFHISFLRV